MIEGVIFMEHFGKNDLYFLIEIAFVSSIIHSCGLYNFSNNELVVKLQLTYKKVVSKIL